MGLGLDRELCTAVFDINVGSKLGTVFDRELGTVLDINIGSKLGTVVLDIRLVSNLGTAVLDRELDTVLNIKLGSELGT